METQLLIKGIAYKANKETPEIRTAVHILLLKIQLGKPEEMTKYIKEIRDLLNN